MTTTNDLQQRDPFQSNNSRFVSLGVTPPRARTNGVIPPLADTPQSHHLAAFISPAPRKKKNAYLYRPEAQATITSLLQSLIKQSAVARRRVLARPGRELASDGNEAEKLSVKERRKYMDASTDSRARAWVSAREADLLNSIDPESVRLVGRLADADRLRVYGYAHIVSICREDVYDRRYFEGAAFLVSVTKLAAFWEDAIDVRWGWEKLFGNECIFRNYAA